jgi:arylsulfatase A-like enzyme
MHSRALVLSLIILAFSGSAVAAAPGPAEVSAAGAGVNASAGRPDIVVVLVDDLPEIDGRLWQLMPNIRRTFVEGGLTFSNAHVESPLCCPGRAGYLTGLHTFNHGVTQNDVSLFDDSMTVATQVQDAGYFTFWTGKYLNGYTGIAPYVPPGWDRFHAMAPGYYDYRIWNNGNPTPQVRGSDPEDYFTDVLRRKAVKALRRAPAGQPLFGFVSVYAPHGPTIPAPRHQADPGCEAVPAWAPPNYNEKDVSDKPAYVRSRPRLPDAAWDLTDVCGTLLAVDDLVGALRDELADQGRLANTLLVLSSDNGMNFGAHRLERKSTPYATQVPMMASWPAVLGSKARRIAAPVLNIDLAPTACELAGCTLGPYPNGQSAPDGQSLVPWLTGSGAMERDEFITDMPDGGRNVPPWFAVTTSGQSQLAGAGCALESSGGCRWHYVEYETGERELYDVSNGPCWAWNKAMSGDPCELDNLAGDGRYRSIEVRLRNRLAELRAEGG